jgi:hypothetical protein
MKPPPIHSPLNRDLDAEATDALEAARLMPPGADKTDALKRPGSCVTLPTSTGCSSQGAAGLPNKAPPRANDRRHLRAHRPH